MVVFKLGIEILIWENVCGYGVFIVLVIIYFYVV